MANEARRSRLIQSVPVKQKLYLIDSSAFACGMAIATLNCVISSFEMTIALIF